MLRDSVVVRTRPRAIPLAMITIRKILHGFPFLSHDDYGAPLGVRAAGAPLQFMVQQKDGEISLPGLKRHPGELRLYHSARYMRISYTKTVL